MSPGILFSSLGLRATFELFEEELVFENVDLLSLEVQKQPRHLFEQWIQHRFALLVAIHGHILQ